MATKPIEAFKRCSKCGVAKPADLDHFTKKLDGLTSQCKVCLSVGKRRAWAKNADSINAARRASRDDETRRKDRERYAQNPEKKRRSVYAWRVANPEKRAEISARHYRKYEDKKKKQAADWSAKNADRKRANMRRWSRERRRSDPKYRLKQAVGSYVRWCLKGRKEGKRTEEILGYSIAELRSHLERQFLPGMSWENYGDWHVDHILPVASFNFDSADHPDFRACWALTNLRPLWAADNIAKSDKRIHLI